MKVLVKTRYGDYTVETKSLEIYEEENVVYLDTLGGQVAFYGWTALIPEKANPYVEEVKPEEEPEPRMVDYRQVSPEEAVELVKQGYEYTGERWKGMVAVAKYEEEESGESED